ncbi:MAG TPA: MerR family transcriptional regulator [Pseudonocardia sp.]|jgi:DNA-binding transcriptional MerR regulator|nr:MerR family transcriptional regulator [Pseudonocardia sp.]
MSQDAESPPDPGPGWRAGAVAARLGVAASTLRSWNQRYDLGPSGHRSGRHRRYTTADLARLEHMRALVAAGVAPAEAARWARDDTARTTGNVHAPSDPIPKSAITGLLAAAHRLEGAALAGALRRHLAEHGVITTWDQLCRPVLSELGRRHLADGDCIDAEHLVSWTISFALHQVAESERAPGSRTALLACAATERHTLSLEALRAALGERGTPAHMLGADLPTEALVAALTRLRPDVVVVWAHTPRAARRSYLRALDASEHRPGLVIAAGPGWDTDHLPAGVRTADSLRAAVELIRS